jgi:tetratricopeptide (TPR) repeat protein
VSASLQRIHQRFVIVVDFAGVVLLWGASIFFFGGGMLMMYLTVTSARGTEVQIVVTVVLLWAVAIWLALRGRNEFREAMAGGLETAKTLTEKSVLEVLSHGVALRDESLCEEFRRLQGAPARDLFAWANAKLATYPEDVGLLFLAAETYLELGIASGAEGTLRKIRAGILSANAGWIVDLLMARSLYLQDRWDDAEQLCARCIDSEVSARHKATFIDQLVCEPLFSSDERHFARLEEWARKAVAIDRRNISLKGTLGGILAEQSRADEARPFLKQCLRSRSPHDRAISTFYLGIIERRAGNLVEAERLFARALSIWTAPWFVARIRRELAALQTPSK